MILPFGAHMLLQHALTRACAFCAQFSGLEISADGRVNKDSLLKYMSTDSDFSRTDDHAEAVRTIKDIKSARGTIGMNEIEAALIGWNEAKFRKMLDAIREERMKRVHDKEYFSPISKSSGAAGGDDGCGDSGEDGKLLALPLKRNHSW